jgi:uncharacterized membrane protein YkoI
LGWYLEARDIDSMKIHLITLVAAAGLLVGCDRSIESASRDYNSLPSVVQKTIRAEAPNAEIANISTKSENGMDVYEIQFRDSASNPALVVAADGRVLSSGGVRKADSTASKIGRALTPTGAVGTKFSALPESVQKTIQANAPADEIVDISRREDTGRVVYEIEFKDKTKNPTMRVAEDGTVVQ